MNCEFPSVGISKSEEICKILKDTKIIVILGLSPNPEKASNKVAKYLQEQGYKIIPVYPKEDLILGEKVYRSLDEINEAYDMIDMFRKPSVANTVVSKLETLEHKPKYLWLQEGLVNNEACEKAEKLGIKTIQNKCTLKEHKLCGEKS